MLEVFQPNYNKKKHYTRKQTAVTVIAYIYLPVFSLRLLRKLMSNIKKSPLNAPTRRNSLPETMPVANDLSNNSGSKVVNRQQKQN